MGYLDPKRMKGNKSSGIFLAILYAVCTIAVFIFMGIIAYRLIYTNFLKNLDFNKGQETVVINDNADVIQEGNISEETAKSSKKKKEKSVKTQKNTEKKSKKKKSKKKKSKKSSDAYIIPGINTRYIKYADLKDLSEKKLRLACNEVYARHGRIFLDKTLRQYFNSCSWYRPKLNPDEFDESVFNKYEKENIKTIVKYEEENGYR